MLIPNLPADLAALIDHDLIEQRRRDYEAIDERWRKMNAEIVDADRAIQEAKRRRADLAAQVARGHAVAPAEIAAAANAVTEAEAKAAFAREAVAAIREVWQEVHDLHAVAPREAATHALAEVARRRVTAAETIDVRRHELARAEAEWHSLAKPFDSLRQLAIGTIARQGIWRAAEHAICKIPKSAADEKALWAPHLDAQSRLHRAKAARNRARVPVLEAGLRTERARQKRRRLENTAIAPLGAFSAIDTEISAGERAERVAAEDLLTADSTVRAARADLAAILAALVPDKPGE
jgi:hypothetical protein